MYIRTGRVYIYMCMHTWNIYICVCACVCVYVMYLFMCVYMYVNKYMYMYIYIYVYVCNSAKWVHNPFPKAPGVLGLLALSPAGAGSTAPHAGAGWSLQPTHGCCSEFEVPQTLGPKLQTILFLIQHDPFWMSLGIPHFRNPPRTCTNHSPPEVTHRCLSRLTCYPNMEGF